MSREAESLDERWEAFREEGLVRNHWWWRPGWRAGRSFYTWHITFDGADELHEMVRRLQDAITSPAADPVPQEGLHLTMQGLGFTDEVKDADVSAIVEAARARLAGLRPFTLEVGPVDPDTEGIGLLVQPWAPVVEVRSAIRDAIGDVWGQDGVPEEADGFRPHLTLDYIKEDASAGPLIEELEPLREVPAVRADVREAQLIRLNRDNAVYAWDVVASVPLGG